MRTTFIVVVVLIIVVGIGYAVTRKTPVTEMPMGGAESGENTTTTQMTGRYEAYAPERLAYAAEGAVVLFFHAPWCPTCRATEAAIAEEGIPEGITLLKVDYDNATTLRQQYGVTTQHTFVQVDSEGNEITKWQGTITPIEIASRIQ